MRVAFCVNGFPATSETFVLNQIIGLLNRGHEVDVFSEHGNKTGPSHPDLEKNQILERTTYAERPCGRAIRVFKAGYALATASLHGRFRFWSVLDGRRFGRPAWNLSLACRAAPFLSRPTYDVVQCHFGPAGIFAQTLRDVDALRGPMITMFHGYDASLYIRQHGPGVYKHLFASGDLFTCPSEFVRKRLITAGCPAEKVQRFKLGTDLKRFSFKERFLDSSGVIRLVTVARLTEKKGLEYSIRAVAKLSQRFAKLEYNIIGDGDLRPELTQLIEALGVGSTVRLLGWKTQDEVQVLLDQAHVFVLASVESRNGDIEGLPMVLQEAQAMGLPVVCTRHSGLPEGILDGKSGFLVPERDADALADRLADVISRPETWPEMGRQGRAFIENEYDL
ncbi:MAG TPA: glycosyltransferase, partial [Chthoniobacterales bacterium]|nr:glycosyltransferase [Chthoniobacterales bacterium]